MLRLRCECEFGHTDDLAARHAELEGRSIDAANATAIAGFYLWARAALNSVAHSCMIRNPLFRRFQVKENPLYQSKAKRMPSPAPPVTPPSRSEPEDRPPSGLLCGLMPKRDQSPGKKRDDSTGKKRDDATKRAAAAAAAGTKRDEFGAAKQKEERQHLVVKKPEAEESVARKVEGSVGKEPAGKKKEEPAGPGRKKDEHAGQASKDKKSEVPTKPERSDIAKVKPESTVCIPCSPKPGPLVFHEHDLDPDKHSGRKHPDHTSHTSAATSNVATAAGNRAGLRQASGPGSRPTSRGTSRPASRETSRPPSTAQSRPASPGSTDHGFASAFLCSSRPSSPTPMPAKVDVRPKVKVAAKRVESASTGACMPFCISEIPGRGRTACQVAVAAAAAEDKRPRSRQRGQSCERKRELNKGGRSPSAERISREKAKEQWMQLQEFKEAARKKRSAKPGDKKQDARKQKKEKKGKKEKLSKDAKAKLELQKRQEKPISFLDCPICHKMFRHAVEIECGHAFCYNCLRRKMRRSKLCPICMTEIEYVHPSYVLRELVDKFGTKDGPKRLKADLLQGSSYFDEQDPIVLACQFVSDSSEGCCSCSTRGAFDPADLYKSARLEEYMSTEEYLDTVKMVNQIISTWTGGTFQTCLGTLCCCLFPSQVKRVMGMIEVVLGDCNLRWPETGQFWTLMYLSGDRKSARSLEKVFLTLRIDPGKARAYQMSLRAGGPKKDMEIARLRKQNALMRHKMLELGQNSFIRALSGRKCSRYSLKTSASLSFIEEYPDSPVISPLTLRDLVLHNPASKKYFIAPWNRLRSTSTGPLALTSEEDSRMRSQLNSIISRSPSPYLDRSTRGNRSRSPRSRNSSPGSSRSHTPNSRACSPYGRRLVRRG